MRQIADRLHRAGLKVIMATLTPFAGHDAARLLQPREGRQADADQPVHPQRALLGRHRRLRARRSPTPPTRCGCCPPTTAATTCTPTTPGMKALADAITWLDDPSIPIEQARRRASARRSRPTLALDARRAAASFGALDAGRDAGVHGLDDRDGHQHGGRRGAHGRGPGPPDERRRSRSP